MKLNKKNFVALFRWFQEQVYMNAVDKGWYSGPERSDGDFVALIHAEVSEVLESFRDGNPESQKVPPYTEMEEELADVVIRCMDYAQARGLDLGGAIVAKFKYNKTRPYRHGGKKL